MNIFAVSDSPLLCARALDDKRLRKMILEAAQVLCTVINLTAGQQITPYRNSHPHNPVTIWAKDPRNFHWLLDLGLACGVEYEHRFGKRHASQKVIEDIELEWLVTHIENGHDLPLKPLRWHNGAAHRQRGISFKHIADTHLAYRLYLRKRWATDIRYPVWTKRSPPKWAEV